MEYYVESDGTVRSVESVRIEVEENQKAGLEFSPDVKVRQTLKEPVHDMITCPACNCVMTEKKFRTHWKRCPKKSQFSPAP